MFKRKKNEQPCLVALVSDEGPVLFRCGLAGFRLLVLHFMGYQPPIWVLEAVCVRFLFDVWVKKVANC